LENNLLLYYTATSRESARIIEVQSRNVTDKKARSIEAMHQLKVQAQLMKEALLMGRIHEIGEILDFGFRQKQKMAEGISNAFIEDIYQQARKAGATGGKISGAGGGGFMTFYCPGVTKHRVMEVLQGLGGHCRPYQFTSHGLTTWTV
jgi:D-glycero-alpha-D-manno-heptose-7-phosphate kinase